jgi:molybdenum cofactor cytidylyltransferase
MSLRPAIVVLAAVPRRPHAGGTHPLLQSLGPGNVLSATLRHAAETRWPVVVVTTEDLAATAAAWVAPRDLIVLDETDAARGQGYAVSIGVSAQARAAGWLVLPGGMPLVRPATLLAVGAALAEQPVAYAQYHGRRGHPVGFAAELYSELAGLSGDGSARRLVARYPALPVEVDDPGVLMDVDTDTDLAALRAAPGAA